MKPIFISYSSEHRDITRALAEAIEAQCGPGSVWWDHALESWGDYEIQIRNAHNGAQAVVVIWTKAAGESDWVKSEAGRANRAGKLVNVRAPDTAWRDVPSPYDQHHFKDLDDIEGILKTIVSVLLRNWRPGPVPLHEFYFRHHGHLLINPKQTPLGRDPREISPTELLQAKYTVVPYVDVTGMKADLIAWCRDGARATAGRLIHGPGGLGKTRLMIEVAAALRADGWMAGFLDRPHDQAPEILRQRWQALDDLIAHGDDKGLVIVMDYGEARQDEVKAMAERLSRRPDHDTRPVRLVLLTRTAGEWWTTLHDESPDLQRLFRRDARGPGVIALKAIAAPEQRRELFFASAQAMAPTLAAQGYVNPATPSRERLTRVESGASHARPLAVQMEALLWLASMAPEAGLIGVDELLRRVLGLERDHWGKLLVTLDDDGKRDIARGVAQATVVLGTNSKPSTETLLMADRFYGDQRKVRVAVDPVIRGLLRLYGKPDDKGVVHLEPDLIGEHHVAAIGDVELIDGCLEWIGTKPEAARAKRRKDFLTVLQRATQPDHGPMAHRAATLLDHLVRNHVKELAADMVTVMVDTPGTLALCLDRRLDGFDDDALAAIDAALPLHSVTLMELSRRIAVRRADLASERDATVAANVDAAPEARHESLSLYARRLNNLGIRLSDLGRSEEALTALQQSVNVWRGLAASRPDAFLPYLAMSLNNLGGRLSDLGRREDALAASQESVNIRRSLVANQSDAFLPGLANSLNNSGPNLSSLGRHEEARAASQEAVDIYRGLAETRPEAFLPKLGSSLNNLGADLSNLARREHALAMSQEAFDIYRGLAASRPDAFLPDLASTLSNLAIRLFDVGRGEAGLAASQEAADIRRRLATYRPGSFLPDLAKSLNNLGEHLAALGHLEEALEASQEAVDIYRGLATSRPDAFLPDLAQSLNNLGIRLSSLHRRPDEALAVCQEAVNIRRCLAASRPEAFQPDLAKSHGVLSRALAAAERHADAAVVAREGLATIAPFAERHADMFGDLARVLGRDHLAACDKAGIEADIALLGRIAQALGAD